MNQDLSPGTRIGLDLGIGPAVRSPPRGEMLRIGEHAEHQHARRIERAREDDLALRDRLRGGFGGSSHGYPSNISVGRRTGSRQIDITAEKVCAVYPSSLDR